MSGLPAHVAGTIFAVANAVILLDGARHFLDLARAFSTLDLTAPVADLV